jgi:hypothetical protein
MIRGSDIVVRGLFCDARNTNPETQANMIFRKLYQREG